jgi:hypothetical protein
MEQLVKAQAEHILRLQKEKELLRKTVDHIYSFYSKANRSAEVKKNAVYLERNQVVVALARLLQTLGCTVGLKKTTTEDWNPKWADCLYIDLPDNQGQISWHFHESHKHLLEGFPEYLGDWDNHTTEQKYARLGGLDKAHFEREHKEETFLKGYREGEENGHSHGYDIGFADGYEEGFNKASTDSINNTDKECNKEGLNDAQL